ncbi:MAG: ABC transporter permease, partial [Deltaproteobacteria bacterium]|nr:ABC transporter permease [Deltaproteobacteria bacterium]
PIAAVLSHLVHFGMELALVFSFMLVFPDAYHLNASLVGLPILTLLVLVIAAGAALATAGLHVKYRDVHYVVTSLFTVGFWATPILYPLDMAPAPLRAVIRLNPLTGVIEGARAIILRGVFPSALDLVPAAVTGVTLFLLGCAIFRRQNLHVADYL